MTMFDTSTDAYVAYDRDGESLGTSATFEAAKDIVRDELSFDLTHERDLGTLAVMRRGDRSPLPFSGCVIKTTFAECHRSLALARALEIPLDDITATADDGGFDHGSDEYLVLTDDEAQERAIEDCRESAWAFNLSFLGNYLPEGGGAAVAAIQDQCEGANAAVLALLGSRADEAFEEAISVDGRGHFLASYDGAENEQTIGSETFYIYRRN